MQSRAGLKDLRIFAKKRGEVGNDIERTGRVGNDVAGGVDERAGDAEIGEIPSSQSASLPPVLSRLTSLMPALDVISA